MKKQNLFFAIVMISFTSTFMSCQKEALITSDIQADSEIQATTMIPNDKGSVVMTPDLDAEIHNLNSFQIPNDNNLVQAKNVIDIDGHNISFEFDKVPTTSAIKLSKNVCINGGVTLIAERPNLTTDEYKYQLRWISDAVYINPNQANVLSCVCSGTYLLQVVGNGEVLESMEVEVKADCEKDIKFDS